MEFGRNLPMRICYALFSLVLLLGASVVLGWILDIPELYRIAEGFAPMQFNNALCFILIGASGLLLVSEKKTPTILTSGFGLILSGITFIQYPFGIDAGIDTLFFNTHEIVPTAHPGRMAPNSAIAHILAFSSLILASLGRVIQVRFAGVLGVSAFAAGATSLIVYGIDPGSGFDWGRYTKMAIHTSMGFAISGAAIVLTVAPKLHTWVDNGSIKKFYIWPYLTVLLSGALIIELQLPQNVATGLLYAVVIALTWFGKDKRDFLIVAGVSTLIIVVDITVSSGAFNFSEMVVNRTISLVSVWFAATILYYFKGNSNKLKESEGRLRSIFESSGEGILVVDDQMLIQMANERLELMFGYEPDELNGKRLDTLIPQRFHPRHENHTKGFLNEGTTRQMSSGAELFGVRKDGSEFPVEVGLSSFQLEGERFVSANVSDITEKVQAQKVIEEGVEELKKAEFKFRSIYDNTYQFIGLLEPDGTLIEANKTALDFGGFTLEQARGQDFGDSPWFSLSTEIQDQLKEAIKRAAKGEFVRYDVDNVGGDGTIIRVDFSLRPIFDENGKVIYLVPEGRNISDRIELESKLRANEKLLQQFVSNTPNAVAMFNNNLEYVVASDTWYTDYGIEEKEIIGQHHYDVFPEIREMPHWIETHQRALKGETIRRERDHFVREDGSVHWMRYVIQPWKNEHDQIGGIIMFTEVITERVKLELQLADSERRFNLAVKGTTAGVWDWLDIDNDVQWWSPRFYELLGYSEGEIEPKLETFSSLLHPDDNEMTFKLVDRHFKKKAPFIMEYRLKHKEKGYRWFLGAGQALWNDEGKPTRMVGTIVDIHARKLGEEAEIKHARQLAEKNKELEEFTYVASHDLQEPVRTIASFVELFREFYADKLDDQANEFLDLMEGASLRSQQLISDLLQYSRIGRKRELSAIDMNELVGEVVDDLTLRIRETEAELQVADNLPQLMGFRTELRLLVQNLVTNALKFTRENVSPRVVISFAENEEEYEFLVADNGIGIDEKFFDQIFVVFKRLHGRSEFEGTGIGLAHCKKVVDLHRGRIWVTSKVGEGTTFHFTIPKNIEVETS